MSWSNRSRSCLPRYLGGVVSGHSAKSRSAAPARSSAALHAARAESLRRGFGDEAFVSLPWRRDFLSLPAIDGSCSGPSTFAASHSSPPGDNDHASVRCGTNRTRMAQIDVVAPRAGTIRCDEPGPPRHRSGAPSLRMTRRMTGTSVRRAAALIAVMLAATAAAARPLWTPLHRRVALTRFCRFISGIHDQPP